MCESFTWGTQECCETACTHFCPLELALSCLKQHLTTHAAKRAHEEAEQKKQQRADSCERERVADAHPTCAHAEDGEDLLGQAASYRAREATSGREKTSAGCIAAAFARHLPPDSRPSVTSCRRTPSAVGSSCSTRAPSLVRIATCARAPISFMLRFSTRCSPIARSRDAHRPAACV